MKLGVLLITYNHEKYIAQAIDSILMQKVDFSYEIVVADDASTDKTRAIIQNYSDKNPGKFKILPIGKNLGITKNYQRAFAACEGKYIAVLEGDDVWTSVHKLQKQVDFLDDHTDCSFCFNKLIIKEENSGIFKNQPSADFIDNKKILFASDLARVNFIGNFSACMYRKSIINSIDNSLYDLKVYDWMVNIVCAQSGPIGYLNEPMSVYRLHDGGSWSTKKDEEKENELMSLIDEYDKFLDGKFHEEFMIHKKNTESYSIKKILKLFIPKIVWIVIDLFVPKIFTVCVDFLRKKKIT